MPPSLPPPSVPCLLWAGLSVGGVVAATSKFRAAPPVSRADLLLVGREQFSALRRAEAVLALLSGCAAVAASSGERAGVAVACVASAAQAGVVVPWIRREAARRTEEEKEAAAGGERSAALSHTVQVGLEVAKIGALLYVGSFAK